MTKYFDERTLRGALEIGYNCDHCSCDAQRCADSMRFTKMEVCDIIDNLPVADVAPVKHAHWIYEGNVYVAKCSGCGNFLDMRGVNTDDRGIAHFCPICGAIMDEEVE